MNRDPKLDKNLKGIYSIYLRAIQDGHPERAKRFNKKDYDELMQAEDFFPYPLQRGGMTYITDECVYQYYLDPKDGLVFEKVTDNRKKDEPGKQSDRKAVEADKIEYSCPAGFIRPVY